MLAPRSCLLAGWLDSYSSVWRNYHVHRLNQLNQAQHDTWDKNLPIQNVPILFPKFLAPTPTPSLFIYCVCFLGVRSGLPHPYLLYPFLPSTPSIFTWVGHSLWYHFLEIRSINIHNCTLHHQTTTIITNNPPRNSFPQLEATLGGGTWWDSCWKASQTSVLWESMEIGERHGKGRKREISMEVEWGQHEMDSGWEHLGEVKPDRQNEQGSEGVIWMKRTGTSQKEGKGWWTEGLSVMEKTEWRRMGEWRCVMGDTHAWYMRLDNEPDDVTHLELLPSRIIVSI